MPPRTAQRHTPLIPEHGFSKVVVVVVITLDACTVVHHTTDPRGNRSAVVMPSSPQRQPLGRLMTPLVLTMPLPGAPAQPMQYTPGPDLLPADAYKETLSPASAKAKLLKMAEMLKNRPDQRSTAAGTENKRRNATGFCGVPQFQLPQRTPGQTRQARDGRRGPPGGAWAGPGAHCGVGPAWVLGLFVSRSPVRRARWLRRSSVLSPSQVAKAPYCALLSAQPRPAAGRATPWPGPPCDRPPQSASVEEVSRLA